VKFEIRVANAPFFVRGISFGDLIRVRPAHDRRELVFESFTAESGHSTVRLIEMKSGGRELAAALIRNAGCSFETSESTAYIAIDIPSESDYGRLRADLLKLKEDGFIGIQESAISKIHRRQLPELP
jgi:Domain of unknown function (DUF4265)